MNLIIIILIAANVIMSLKGFNDGNFFHQYKFTVSGIKRGEYIRMLSSGFLHVDYLHLGFNMYALYLFSSAVLSVFSIGTFLIIYFVSLLGGNYFSLYRHKNNPYYAAVGASGAVSGIVFASIIINPEMSLYMLPFPFPIKGYIFGIGYLLYSIYGMKKQLGNTGHSAHLGGAIAGYVLTILLHPNVLQYALKEVLILAIPIVLLFIMENRNK